jgi:hypothetical protein
MKKTLAILLLAVAASAQNPPERLPAEDSVRIAEFYRLASEIQDHLWPNWSKTPAPLLLVTQDTEFLTHHANPPTDFKDLGNDLYARPRQFPTAFQATFPAFGPPSVIVVGEPQNTASKTSTPWLIVLMHEHFHQLQDEQPGYLKAVDSLGLSRGDTTGMWMLNYPFPYEKQEVAQSFAGLRDLLLDAVHETDRARFAKLANRYLQQRRRFFALLAPDDRKYFSFELWKEGIARYTQIKAAEAAATYRPTAEYTSLHDFEAFSDYATKARNDTLDELKHVDLPKSKRIVVYSFGATEGLLLDRLKPRWREKYFEHLASMDSFFNE